MADSEPEEDAQIPWDLAPKYCGRCEEELEDGEEAVCQKCQDADPDEPEEGDITTGDHVKFYQYGKPYIFVLEGEDYRKEIKRLMEDDQFFPNVWFISDQGNAHLMDLEDK